MTMLVVVFSLFVNKIELSREQDTYHRAAVNY